MKKVYVLGQLELDALKFITSMLDMANKLEMPPGPGAVSPLRLIINHLEAEAMVDEDATEEQPQQGGSHEVV